MSKLLILTLLLLSTFSLSAEGDKTVFFALLARNKSHVLPRYLQCIDSLDYDKKLMTVYINTNNNEDNTLQILQEWAKTHSSHYREIVFESHEVKELSSTNPHDWTANRLKVLGEIRNKSLQKAKEQGCAYYFVVDCDNFIAPYTLKELIRRDKPIIAPMLRPIPEPGDQYSNFYCDTTPKGYFKDHPDYLKIFNYETLGTFKVPVVHCTYLIKSEYIDKLSYVDTSDCLHEFVNFSRSARKNQVDQYICNEKPFGVLVRFYTNVTQEEENRRLFEYFSSERWDF